MAQRKDIGYRATPYLNPACLKFFGYSLSTCLAEFQRTWIVQNSPEASETMSTGLAKE
jgi:hypothetical protein